MGVVTGVPMEFQFGTNWAAFSKFAGGVIGQTLAMEGLFAFFLESSFLGLLVFGEKRLGPRGHYAAAVALLVGSWLSGYFITATNAFMQHPVGHAVAANGSLELADFWTFLLNPWALAQYAHNMVAAVVTGSFVMTAVGAYYALNGEHPAHARIFLPTGVSVALISCARRVPDRRSPGQAGRAASADFAGGDGGPLRKRPDGRHYAHRPAERRASGGSTIRSPCLAR